MRDEDSGIEERILRLIEKERPENISSLLKVMRERMSLKEDEALKHIIQLVNKGKIRLRGQPKPPPESLKAYMRSIDTYWFWITVSLAVATAIAVFTIPENAYPIVYMRYVLGSIFVLWLPGYVLIKMLFPSRKDLDSIERIALSIGLSLALVPLVGLLLNYTPWGIRLTPITLSLLALTLIFAVTALIREYQLQTRT
ncbi:MAG: DUF1616 domain-containing protein [Candidatus Bathyarchaeia archaeon]